MDVYKLKNDESILKMKNPYGPAEWRGKYFYGDQENLTKEVKKELKYQRHSWNDGIFYLSLRDFIHNFDSINICHYRKSHKLSSLEDFIHEKTKFAYYQFSIKETHSKSKNLNKLGKIPTYIGFSKKENQEETSMSLIVGKYTDEGFIKFIGGCGGFNRDEWCMKEGLPVGKYFVTFVSNSTANSKCTPLTIWAYGAEEIRIQRIHQIDNINKCQELFHGLIADYVFFLYKGS